MALFEKKTIIKNEIDYDKLAEKIVFAQEKLIKNNRKDFESTIIDSVTTAINKSKKSDDIEGKATITLIQLLASLLLFIGFFFAIVFTVVLITTIITTYSETPVLVFIMMCFIALSSILITILIGLSTIEVYRTKNIKLINTAFSALMAFAAIVIAIIQLVKGM